MFILFKMQWKSYSWTPDPISQFLSPEADRIIRSQNSHSVMSCDSLGESLWLHSCPHLYH